jgi:succinate dehydrogenase hydrophobic anchor subunit
VSGPSEVQFTVADAGAALRRRCAYLLLRISGLLLTVLVLGHFLVTHITTDVANTNSLFIDQRWASNLWAGWDGLMLAATILHAVLGLWAVTADYSSGKRRRVLRALVLGLALFVFTGGMLLLVVAVGAR